MLGPGDTNYGKKADKSIVPAGGYHPHGPGPGEKDASPHQWKINWGDLFEERRIYAEDSGLQASRERSAALCVREDDGRRAKICMA